MAKKSAKWQAKQKAKAEKDALKAERRQHRRKAHAVLPRTDMADQLRALAFQIEGGTVVLGDTELDLPEHANFVISYKLRKRGGHQLEVEIEWGDAKSVSLLATE